MIWAEKRKKWEETRQDIKRKKIKSWGKVSYKFITKKLNKRWNENGREENEKNENEIRRDEKDDKWDKMWRIERNDEMRMGETKWEEKTQNENRWYNMRRYVKKMKKLHDELKMTRQKNELEN